MINHTQVQYTLLNLLKTRLKWPVPEDNNAEITGYSITFCETFSGDECPPSVMDSVLSVSNTRIIRATPASRMRVEIAAINEIGKGYIPDQPFFFNTYTAGE